MSVKTVVGLTGGIASGKSVAARMFADAGAYTIDTDVVSRQVSDGEGKAALFSAFADAFADGVLDRRALRAIVFADEQKRLRLNAILHPLIYKETERQIRQASARIVAVEAPLLFEAGFDALVDVTVTVSCPERVRLARLTARDGMTEEQARRMIAAQWTDKEREARADFVLYNDGDTAKLQAQVTKLYGVLAKRR